LWYLWIRNYDSSARQDRSAGGLLEAAILIERQFTHVTLVIPSSTMHDQVFFQARRVDEVFRANVAFKVSYLEVDAQVFCKVAFGRYPSITEMTNVTTIGLMDEHVVWKEMCQSPKMTLFKTLTVQSRHDFPADCTLLWLSHELLV
jgi:hypothetical protein